MGNILSRIQEIALNEGIGIGALERSIGASKGVLSRAIKNGTDIQSKWISILVENYPQYSPAWVLTGEGNMILDTVAGKTDQKCERKKNLIPFYDDVASIGGVNSISASMDGKMPSNEWIDAGDWFLDATAAIRHYGDSMCEYPSGCILALKELHDKRQIIWGKNYCVETDEMRVTKRLQNGADDYVLAYSTNTETYPDGHLIHEPFPIYKDTIRRIFMVIGCVIKEYSSGPIEIKKY